MNKLAVFLLVTLTGGLAFVAGKFSRTNQALVPSAPLEATAGDDSSQCPVAHDREIRGLVDQDEGLQQPSLIGQEPDQTKVCDDTYAGMGPVDLLALPTDFEQTTALYTIAQHADIATLKRYVNETQGIAVEGERSAALSILFMRYSDLNPQAALDDYYAMGLQGNSNILYPMFSSWAKADLATAIERVHTLPNAADQRTAKRAIMRANASAEPVELEWIASQLGEPLSTITPQALSARARTEPQAAARAALKLADFQARSKALVSIARTWSERDVEAALTYSAALDNRQDRNQFMRGLLNVLAKQDPQRAISLAADESTQIRQTVLAQVMNTFVEKNPHQGLSLALKQSSSGDRNTALLQLFSRWAQKDPAGAGVALDEVTDLSTQEAANIGMTVAQQMMQSDPEQGLAWAKRWDDKRSISSHQHSAWDSAVTALSQTDAAQAMALASELPPGQRRSQLVSQVLSMQAMFDPQAAAALMDTLPPGETRRNAATNIAQQWLQKDPVMAMDWLLSMPAEQREDSVRNAGWMLANIDFELAAAYTADLTAKEQEVWIPTVVQHYAISDPDDAIAWLQAYKDHPSYGSWLGTVAASRVATDPKAALALLDQLDNRQQFVRAQAQVIAVWSTVDPKAVGKWWHRLDDEERSVDALGMLVSTWSQSDRDASRKWVLRLSDTAERDAALLHYVNNAGLQPKDASKLIIEIEDPQQRFSAYQNFLWPLISTDRSEAEQWITNARLEPDLKSQLQQQLELSAARANLR